MADGTEAASQRAAVVAVGRDQGLENPGPAERGPERGPERGHRRGARKDQAGRFLEATDLTVHSYAKENYIAFGEEIS